ncbi:MAG: amino acid synthesis family protein [Microbacteriaceae bacterium]
MTKCQAEVRKLITVRETMLREAGLAVPTPLTVVVSAAIIRNPWADSVFVEDLVTDIRAIAPGLGKTLTDAMMAEMGDSPVEAYGKAAAVGLGGELEHASALIHTLTFGNILRERVGGTSYLPFTNRRTPAGTQIAIPMVHTQDSGTRSHYLTADLTVGDAPLNDEILIAIACASSGRPFARIGDRYEDMEMLAAQKLDDDDRA